MLLSFFKRIMEEPFRSRQKKRIEKQGDYSKVLFINELLIDDIPEKVAETIWNLFSKEISTEIFLPMPNDDIAELYGIVDEDFEDLVDEVLTACNRILPSQEELRVMKPIETIRELALFVSGCNQVTEVT